MELSSPPHRLATDLHESDFSDFVEDEQDTQLLTSKSPYFTQPTQIVDRPTLKPKAPRAPSPDPIIEVPASSPFRPHSALVNGGRLANAMAPAGTTFRPPARVATDGSLKRSIIMISDDELDTPTYKRADSSDAENGRSARGDIRPSSFQAAKKQKLSTEVVKAPPKTQTLLSLHKKPVKAAIPPKPFVKQKDWVALSSDSEPSSRENSPPAEPTPQPKPARRRLMQGRRRRESSPGSPAIVKTVLKTVVKTAVKPAPPAPKTKKPVIVLSDDDADEDAYDNKKSPAPEAVDEDDEELAFTDRVLHYLNNCDTIQLVSITSVKEETARSMLSHQPFTNIAAARSVTVTQMKARAKRASRVTVGDEIVDAVKKYVRALDGIDHIIAVCESQAEAIKKATSVWEMDATGQPRNDKRDDGKPLTPRSDEGSSAKLVALPRAQPKLMDGHCVMKSFQVYGLNWMSLLYDKQYGAILADDMGLGKTCQVISLVCTIVGEWKRQRNPKTPQPWPNLVMVPPSTLANWKAEFKRFAPGLKITIYQGSQAVRDEIAQEILDDTSSHHVILTSYTQVSRQEDIANLRRIEPNVAVFDEGHKMKNPKTKLYKDLIRIKANWRLILSGTPVQNNLMEMISLLRFVEPDLFHKHFDDLEALFNQKVSLTAVSKGALLHSDRVGRARSILEPFILQRKKEQVLKDMPPKTCRVEYCDMDEAQATIYRDYERRFRKADGAQAASAAKGGRDNDNNNVWIQLRKSAIHPQLFRRYFNDKEVDKIANVLMKRVCQSELRQPNIGHLINELKALSDFEIHLWCRDYKCIRDYDLPDGSWLESAKVQALLKLIRQYRKNGDRALVFTRYAKVIELLGESLASSKIEYLALQGSTDVADRQELINRFNEDDTIPVFLLTTGSGGTGINLTAANKVIIFDQSDNPQDDIQAENRAHRLGQTRPVEIVRLISRDTIEELVYKACQKKLELANKVTGWAGVEMTSGEMEAAIRKELVDGNSLATPPNEAD